MGLFGFWSAFLDFIRFLQDSKVLYGFAACSKTFRWGWQVMKQTNRNHDRRAVREAVQDGKVLVIEVALAHGFGANDNIEEIQEGFGPSVQLNV